MPVVVAMVGAHETSVERRAGASCSPGTLLDLGVLHRGQPVPERNDEVADPNPVQVWW